jgi:arylsulfatase A-like enzyme
MGEVLQQAGYTCGLIGKWGLGHEGSTGLPTRQGFDQFFGYLDQHHAHNYYPTFLIHNEERFALENVVPDEDRYGSGKATVRTQYSHDLLVEGAHDFIRDNAYRPFFLYLALTIPHANNEAGQEGMEVPDLGAYAGEDWPEPQKAHAAMISRMDQGIGDLLELLHTLEIDDQTLVLFTSDNGPHQEGGFDPDFSDSNGPLRGIKRSLHDGGIRVPLVARWPGVVPAGVTRDWVGAFWDILPTLAEIGDATPHVPARLDGISFAPILQGRDMEQREHDYLYWAFYEHGGGQALRCGNWKAVQQTIHTPVRLYDLSSDLGEQYDVSAEHPAMVAVMNQLMHGAYEPSERWRFPESQSSQPPVSASTP